MKIQLRLLQSVKMSEKGENEVIRFPAMARAHFGFENHMVIVGKGEYETSLTAKHAWKEDIRRLARMVSEGKISDAEASEVGFVTRSTHAHVTRKEGESIWITEGIESITIGADPEFGLIDCSGYLKRGHSVLPGTSHSKFGADGPGVEVRPSPTRCHIALVRNIQEIFENPPAAANAFRWQGGATHKDSRVYWFGGHIHLGRPRLLGNDCAWLAYTQVAKALDSTLALPMVAFDTPEPYLRRNGCKYNYGKAGDIRADYPEQDRFEYRVLSGLWLTHPTLAKIALGIAKCVTEAAYTKIFEAKCDPDYIKASPSRKGLLKDLNVKRIQEIRTTINTAQPSKIKIELLKHWERQLRSLDLRNRYQEEIDALIELTYCSPEEVIPKLSLDLREGWLKNRPCLPKSKSKLQKALSAVEAKS